VFEGRQISEIRGGAVLFEQGAVGGLFIGVFFVDDGSSAEVR
jgi:hypothetical protein